LHIPVFELGRLEDGRPGRSAIVRRHFDLS